MHQAPYLSLIAALCVLSAACGSPAQPPAAKADAASDTAALGTGDATQDAAADATATGASDTDTFADGDVLAQADAAPPQCPPELITLTEGEEVPPQTLLHLHCNTAWVPGGGAKCTWTVMQPAGSNEQLLPNSSFSNPTLLANAAGEYKFCVKVSAPALATPCTACLNLLVVPNNAVHVELLWDTPSDFDQNDTGPGAGADMDLHFAHPLAAGPDQDCDGKPDPWFSNPFDTFSFNPAPDWGQANSANGNATLDLDDTDGAGPENLNLEQPEGTAADPVAYTVGVHYANDHGFGPSYVAVSVFIEGSLVAQYTKIKMDPLDMWTVGKLWWPSVASGGSKPTLEPCWQAGDSCAAKQNLMWQPKGAACIAKCYVPVSGTPWPNLKGPTVACP